MIYYASSLLLLRLVVEPCERKGNRGGDCAAGLQINVQTMNKDRGFLRLTRLTERFTTAPFLFFFFVSLVSLICVISLHFLLLASVSRLILMTSIPLVRESKETYLQLHLLSSTRITARPSSLAHLSNASMQTRSNFGTFDVVIMETWPSVLCNVTKPI